MSKSRWTFLWRHLRFDDSTTTAERAKKDRFCKIREVFEDLNKNFAKVMYPDVYLGNDNRVKTFFYFNPSAGIDECLFSCRNRIKFRTYNPSKPAKYGINFR